MMKYATALFVTAALGLGAAQTAPVSSAPAAAQTQSAASDPALSRANITIETGRYQGPLSGLLGAIAKSAGYELVLEVNVDTLAAEGAQARPVAYSFRDKPFNEVWPLLMDVYGLNYTVTELGGQPVLRVSNTPVQRVVRLQNADPVAAAEQVKLFFGSPVYSETAQTNAAGANVATTRTIVDVKLDSPTLRIIPDARNRSVIIRGNNAEITQVERLLRELDQDPRGTLASTSAGPSVQEIYSVNGDVKELSTFITAEYPGIRVSTVGSSKQLVLRGAQEDVAQALTLLTKIDPASGAATQRVFQLVNAKADDVKQVLTDTLARQITGAAMNSAGTTGSREVTSTSSAGTNSTVSGTNTALGDATRLASQEATIIADPRTNSLIVRGTPTQVAQIAELIPTLDRKVPQINLQVRIQEINEEATKTLGVNWRVTAGGFNVGILPSGLTASFNPLQTVTGFNIFPALNALESQRVAKRVYDGTVSMQSGQGSLNAGTGSQDASSTAAASIRSGGRLELNIIGAEGSNIEKTIPYGVVLDFFEPSVAPDGTITLRVRGQINELRNREALNAALASGGAPSLLDFLNSDAQTKISFKSGETVLLAGLMAENNSTTKSGLPFLSQIPGLGALAGEQSTTNNGTQMLFVITGDIIE